MNSLVVGCPIKDRAWIFDRWVDHVEDALEAVGITDATFVFVVHPDDDHTIEAIEDRLGEECRSTCVPSWEPGPISYERNWSMTRFQLMAGLRNKMLREVRRQEPDLFWSLDSDILTHPDALRSAVELLQGGGFDAVGQSCFMSSMGTRHPSYAMRSAAGGLQRPFQVGQFPVDVIMAAKVMGPTAYAVDYEAHRQGEDIGWSLAAHRAGLRLGWDGTVTSKHVMKRADLDVVDGRCGY